MLLLLLFVLFLVLLLNLLLILLLLVVELLFVFFVFFWFGCRCCFAVVGFSCDVFCLCALVCVRVCFWSLLVVLSLDFRENGFVGREIRSRERELRVEKMEVTRIFFFCVACLH